MNKAESGEKPPKGKTERKKSNNKKAGKNKQTKRISQIVSEYKVACI